MNRVVWAVLAVATATPAAAQMDMSMPGMVMPARPKPVVRPKPKPVVAKGAPEPSKPAIPPASTPLISPRAPVTEVGAAAPGPANPDAAVGAVPAPPPPSDHAADAIFGTTTMNPSRHMLRRENGGMSTSSVLFNLAEYRVQNGGGGFRWDGEGRFGGDIDRLVVKSEGEATIGKRVDGAEVQALFSHAISPYFNAQGGVRHDFGPGPNRTYATLGIEGLAPYWFDVSAAVFVSERGAVLARLEATYDQRLTQRLILQPRVELNLAAQDVPETGTGAGLSDAELGLRLRYEITRGFAPYVGVSWDGKVGAAARFARAAGERVHVGGVVFGIRTRF